MVPRVDLKNLSWKDVKEFDEAMGNDEQKTQIEVRLASDSDGKVYVNADSFIELILPVNGFVVTRIKGEAFVEFEQVLGYVEVMRRLVGDGFAKAIDEATMKVMEINKEQSNVKNKKQRK